MDRKRSWQLAWATLALTGILAANVGCVGLIANLIYAAKGNRIPARFDGLKKRKVAVVCVESRGAYGPSIVTSQLSQRITNLLVSNVKELEPIEPQLIEDWMDTNNWDAPRFRELGEGVGAESLVVVNLDSFSLHDGATMYRGRANLTLVVYDLLQDGKEVFKSTPPQIQYPVNAGYHTTEMVERDFRQLFVETLAQRIARNFYPYEAIEDFAQDTTLVGR